MVFLNVFQMLPALSLMDVFFENSTLQIMTNRTIPPLGVILLVFISLIAILLYKYFLMVKSLREKEERYRAILEVTPDLMFRVSKKGTFLDFHANKSNSLFTSSDKIIGDSISNLFPDKAELFLKKIKEALSKNEFQSIEYQLKIGDSLESFEARFFKRDDDEVVILIRNITDNLKTEKLLQRSEERYRGIIESQNDLIVRIDNQGKFTFVNEMFSKIFGKPKDELIGSSIVPFIHTDDVFMTLAAREKLKKPPYRTLVEHRVMTQNGWRWIAWEDYALLDENSEILEVQAVGRDITDYKNTILALEESNKLNKAIIENSPLGIAIRNKYGKLLSANRAWQDIWGVSDELVLQYLNDDKDQLIFDDQEEYFSYFGVWKDDVVKIYTEGGHLHIPEIHEKRKNNQILYVSTYFYAIKDNKGEVEKVVILTENITQRRESSLALELSEKLNRTIIDQSPLGITVRNRYGVLLNYNKAWQKIWQISDENIKNYLHKKKTSLNFDERDEYLGDWQEKVRNVYEHGGQLHIPTIKTLDRNNNEKWISHYFYPIMDSNGDVDLVVIITEDISLRKKSVIALEKSELLNRTIIDESPIGITIRNRDGMLLRYNNAWKNIWKIPDEQINNIIKNKIALSLDEKASYLKEWQEEIENLYIKGGQVRISTIEVVDFEENKLWVSHYMYAIKNDVGEIDIVVSLTEDVTDQKEAEKAMRESEEKYRSLFNNIPVGIYRSTVEGVPISLNPGMASMYGYDSPEEMLNINVDDNYHEGDRKKIMQLLEREGSVENLERQFIKKDGSFIWVFTTLVATRDKNNKIIYFDGMDIDITERKLTTFALQESEEKFRTLAENTSVAILIYQLDKLVYANPKSIEITGYSEDELKSMNVWDLFEPNVRDIMRLRGDFRLQGVTVPNNYEVPIITKDGEKKWILYSGALLEYDGKPAIIGTAIDITATRKVRAELRRIEEEKYLQVKVIAGGLAHEVYNSLFPAISSIEKLKQRLQLTTDEDILRNKALIHLTDSAIQRAINMTEFVTEFSKLENVVSYEEINVADFFKNYLIENEEILQKITVTTQISDTISLEMNKLHFHSLIHNFILNARDALEQVEAPKITIICSRTNNSISISIADNGSGISKEIENKIFDSFFSTKPRTGTGLGLAVCKKIVSLYDGEIFYKPSIDNGAQFTILLSTINTQDNTQV